PTAITTAMRAKTARTRQNESLRLRRRRSAMMSASYVIGEARLFTSAGQDAVDTSPRPRHGQGGVVTKSRQSKTRPEGPGGSLLSMILQIVLRDGKAAPLRDDRGLLLLVGALESGAE